MDVKKLSKDVEELRQEVDNLIDVLSERFPGMHVPVVHAIILDIRCKFNEIVNDLKRNHSGGGNVKVVGN